MDDTKCRLCARTSKRVDLENLFNIYNNERLNQIQEVTGLKLQNIPNIPENMCKKCKRELDRAYRFRNICIRAQTYFSTKSCDIKEEMTILGGDLKMRSSSSDSEMTIKEECESLLFSDSFPEDNNEHSTMSSQINGIDGGNHHHSTNEVSDKTIIFENVNTDDFQSDDDEPSVTIHKKMSKQKSIKNNVCQICGAEPSRLSDHLKRHMKNKPFKCRYCEKHFCTRAETVKHERIHTGEKPFVCKDCGRAFSSQSSLHEHVLRLHKKDRSYLCRFCGDGFASYQYLKSHEMQHTGEKPFECIICQVKFSRNSNLQTHYRSKAHKRLEEGLQVNAE